jgi:hypothetical protein
MLLTRKAIGICFTFPIRSRYSDLHRISREPFTNFVYFGMHSFIAREGEGLDLWLRIFDLIIDFDLPIKYLLLTNK